MLCLHLVALPPSSQKKKNSISAGKSNGYDASTDSQLNDQRPVHQFTAFLFIASPLHNLAKLVSSFEIFLINFVRSPVKRSIEQSNRIKNDGLSQVRSFQPLQRDASMFTPED